jgi:hypothetical protein
MTSSNTVYYTIRDKNEVQVGSHSQNVMCLTCIDGLEKFTPAEDYTIQAWGYDEDEDDWEDEPQNLAEWLKKHPAQYTHRKFNPEDRVKVSKRRGEATVLEVIKDRTKFFNEYMVKLDSADEPIKVGQGDLLPI